MTTHKFGFNVQSKVKKQSDDYGIRKNSRNSKDVKSARLIEFDKVQLEDGSIYPTDRCSQSVKGLAKYFRIIGKHFVVEKPFDKPKLDLPNCFKYRRGAMVKGHLKEDKDANKMFYITGYLNV